MSGNRVIAIDGQAGSGKSTLARALSAATALPYLNTGSMYRALTAVALREGLSVDDGAELAERLQRIEFGIAQGDLLIDGAAGDVSLTLPEVEANVSAVARHPQVRVLMAEIQRRLAADGAVMEGRDIATVIFPDAAVKIFLDAPQEVRAARRIAERAADAETVADELAARDARDAMTNPPIPAAGAIVIQTAGRSADEVAAIALAAARERLA